MPAIFPSALDPTDSNNSTFPTTSGGSTNIAEGCAPSNINDAIRSIAAMLAAMWGGVYYGTSRPSNVQSNAIWLDTSGGATAWVFKLYDGSNDISLITVNTSAQTVSFAGDLTGDVTGNVTGNVTGDVTGDLTGDVQTLTTRGDLLYRGASADARLAIGTAGQFLKAGTDDPEYTSDLPAIKRETSIDATNGGLNDQTVLQFTGLPTSIGEAVLMLDDVSLDATDTIRIHLGDATTGDYVTSGYDGYVAVFYTNSTFAVVNPTGGIRTSAQSTDAGHNTGAKITITRGDGNTYHVGIQSSGNNGGTVGAVTGVQSVTLAGDVDRIRVTSNSSSNFDNGTVSLNYTLHA